MAGRATVKPMVITSLATAGAVRMCRKISHSRAKPSSGASSTTARRSEGRMPQPESVCSLWYTIAET